MFWLIDPGSVALFKALQQLPYNLPLHLKEKGHLYGGWFVPFRRFVFSPRNNATRKNEKTLKRHEKRRKDEITPCEKTK